MPETSKRISILIAVCFFSFFAISIYAEGSGLIGVWLPDKGDWDDNRWIFNGNTLILEDDEGYIEGVFNYSVQDTILKITFRDDDTMDYIHELNGDNLIIRYDDDTMTLKRQRTYNLTQYDNFEWSSFFYNLNSMVFSPWAARNNNAATRALNLVNAKDYETALDFGDDTMVRPIFMTIFLLGRNEKYEEKMEEIKALFSNTHNRNMELSQYAVEISRMFTSNNIEAMKRIILFSKNGAEYSKFLE